MNLSSAAARIEVFAGSSLTQTIAGLERDLMGAAGPLPPSLGAELFHAGLALKRAAGQVHVLIHAVGIAYSLPYILEPDEVVEALSLGAGNTGKDFDLVTDRRIAEFKFIHWKGGSESIRQNSVFKDFFHLAEAETEKRRVLYLLELDRPMRFLNGGRALESVMSRNRKLRDAFAAKYGARFSRVREYFDHRRSRVELVDLTAAVPDLRHPLE